MPIIELIFWFAIIGLVTYLVLRYIPMNKAMQQFLPIAVIICCIVWLLVLIGVFPLHSGPRVPRIQ